MGNLKPPRRKEMILCVNLIYVSGYLLLLYQRFTHDQSTMARVVGKLDLRLFLPKFKGISKIEPGEGNSWIREVEL